MPSPNVWFLTCPRWGRSTDGCQAQCQLGGAFDVFEIKGLIRGWASIKARKASGIAILLAITETWIGRSRCEFRTGSDVSIEFIGGASYAGPEKQGHENGEFGTLA